MGLQVNAVERMSEPQERETPKGKQQHVWILKDGQPVQVPVTVGATDGNMTELAGGDITPGTPVIVDVATPRR